MPKNLFLALFVFACCEHALALRCYITDLGVLESEDILSYAYQDCDDYITSMKKKFALDIDQGAPLRCYTVLVNTKKATDNFKIKGCVPQGHCDQTVKPIVVEQAKKRGVRVNSMKCVECMDNGCNRGPF